MIRVPGDDKTKKQRNFETPAASKRRDAEKRETGGRQMRSIFLMPSDDLPSNEVRGRYITIRRMETIWKVKRKKLQS